jgi:hypothetical protein
VNKVGQAVPRAGLTPLLVPEGRAGGMPVEVVEKDSRDSLAD